jgi:hypothetical protein
MRESWFEQLFNILFACALGSILIAIGLMFAR